MRAALFHDGFYGFHDDLKYCPLCNGKNFNPEKLEEFFCTTLTEKEYKWLKDLLAAQNIKAFFHLD